jgi:O-acetyl-ADP-ribose deacetylase (regulator of RNase III)
MINVIKGDLLESNCDYICHQVNCQGKMNSGIAKQIREKWPVVYNNYMSKCDTTSDLTIKTNNILLGSIQIVGLWEDYYSTDFHQSVINMFSQEYYGYDGRRYTSYDAFWNCLNLIKQTVPKGSKIGFPYRIGCGLGGANWEVIRIMIEQVLAEDFEVYIYIL